MSKSYIACICFLLSALTVSSQGLDHTSGVKGIWVTPNDANQKPTKWKAEWIWLDESIEADKIFTRKSFQLNSIPKDALLSITASTKYKLYINGTYVGSGPSRSAAHHQYYDILDISKLLKAGKNTIAITVHYQRGEIAYQYDGRAGLLAQLDYSELRESNTIITNSDWKITQDYSWSNDAPQINRFQLVPSDIVDLRKGIPDWQIIDFDDSEWESATPLMRKTGWPSVQKNAKAVPLTPPWTSLLPRDFPYVTEQMISDAKLIFESVLDSSELSQAIPFSTSQGSGKLQLPKDDSGFAKVCIYDFGSVFNGVPSLKVEGSEGTEIEIRTAPFIVDNKFDHTVVFSNFVDKITLSGKKDQWEAYYFKPTRYLAIVTPADNPSLKISEPVIRTLRYPFADKGNMVSKDAPWVSDFVDATARTIHACTTDAYTDNYRERRQYAQTGYYGAMGNYWIFGDNALQRRYLTQTAHEQKPNGLMPAYAPLRGDDYMVILDSNCLWIRSLRDFYLYSGDKVTVKKLLPAANKLMDLLHSFTNDHGLIDNPPFPYWLDHAQNDRRGANLNLNGHYLGALEDFAQVLEWLGESGVETYKDRAELIRTSVSDQFWNEDLECFVDAVIDGEQSDMYSEHGNAMALAMNIASPVQAEKVINELIKKDGHNFIKRKNGMTVVTPAMSYFLHKGICEYGFVDESLQMFVDRFEKMLAPGSNRTLYEEWWLDGTGRSGELRKTSRSDAQTESCFPPALFGEYLLGLTPTKPGMKELILKKTNTRLNHMQANVPSPMGTLNVEWENGSQYKLSLDIPVGMMLKLDIESYGIPDTRSITVNGKEIKHAELSNHIPFEGGQYKIVF